MEMDYFELMAHDLEMAQTDRNRKFEGNTDEEFWTRIEVLIFKEIMHMRATSKSYHPLRSH